MVREKRKEVIRMGKSDVESLYYMTRADVEAVIGKRQDHWVLEIGEKGPRGNKLGLVLRREQLDKLVKDISAAYKKVGG